MSAGLCTYVPRRKTLAHSIKELRQRRARKGRRVPDNYSRGWRC